jgi:hypothetical protein
VTVSAGFDKWVQETVERVGWAVLSVAPREGSDDPEEWFSYSIGLPKTFGWPELICFGLETETRNYIINDAVEECRKRSITPAPGVRLSAVIKDADVLLVEGSHIPETYLGSANWFARRSGAAAPVAYLQLLWPDIKGFFPGDDRCAPGVALEQAPLETA